LAREQYAEAASLFEEELDTIRALHVPSNLVSALLNCGDVALKMGRFTAARRYLEEAQVLVQEQADPSMTLDVFLGMGSLAWREGDDVRAEAAVRQALDWAGDRFDRARATAMLGTVARRRGDYAQALAQHTTSLRVLREDRGYAPSMTITLRDLALVWAAAGRPADAATLLAAVEAHAAGLGRPVPPVDRPDYEGGLAQARQALGETAFEAAWALGAQMSLEQAVALALDEQRVTNETGAA
jgi:tetratricopeptide (TPR) repeat protein